jgi:hypothetical protein
MEFQKLPQWRSKQSPWERTNKISSHFFDPFFRFGGAGVRGYFWVQTSSTNKDDAFFTEKKAFLRPVLALESSSVLYLVQKLI